MWITWRWLYYHYLWYNFIKHAYLIFKTSQLVNHFVLLTYIFFVILMQNLSRISLQTKLSKKQSKNIKIQLTTMRFLYCLSIILLNWILNIVIFYINTITIYYINTLIAKQLVKKNCYNIYYIFEIDWRSGMSFNLISRFLKFPKPLVCLKR